MRRSPADSTNRSLAALGKWEHIHGLQLSVMMGPKRGSAPQGVARGAWPPFEAIQRVDTAPPSGCP